MGLLCTIIKLSIGLIVAVGILLLTLGLVYAPNKLKFHITAGSQLTRFDYRVDNQLHYNLALNISIRNPNKRYRVYYDTLEVDVRYKNKRLHNQWLPPFFQDTKTTAVVNREFEGQQLLLLGGDELVEFNAEKAAGVYHVDVNMFIRLRLKSDGGLVLKYKPKVYCGLKVPLSNGGANSFVFYQNQDCHFKF